MTSKSSAGSRPVSGDTSMTCTSTFVRSRCARNFVPSPWPRCAPSISPGTSATTKRTVVAQTHDAEIRRQRRERVVGDLRLRRRNPRDQRALAGVRKTDQADIGEQLQPQPQRARFTSPPGLDAARRAVGGRRERRVAAPAAAAPRDQHAFAGVCEVRERDQVVGGLFVHDRAGRHFEHQVRAVVAGAIRSQPVLPALGLEFGMEPVGDERVLVGAGDEVDRTAVSAVAAVRSAARHELLAAKAQAAVAAVACFDLDINFIDEHGGNLVRQFQFSIGLDADDAAVRAVIGELHAAR